MAEFEDKVTLYLVHFVGTETGAQWYDDHQYYNVGSPEYTLPDLYPTREAAQAECDRLNKFDRRHHYWEPDDGPFDRAHDEELEGCWEEYGERVAVPWPAFEDWLKENDLPSYVEWAFGDDDGAVSDEDRAKALATPPTPGDLAEWYRECFSAHRFTDRLDGESDEDHEKREAAAHAAADDRLAQAITFPKWYEVREYATGFRELAALAGRLGDAAVPGASGRPVRFEFYDEDENLTYDEETTVGEAIGLVAELLARKPSGRVVWGPARDYRPDEEGNE